MIVLIVMLWILVGLRVITILLLPLSAGKTMTIEYTDGYIASRSFFNVVSIAILALAAIGLANGL